MRNFKASAQERVLKVETPRAIKAKYKYNIKKHYYLLQKMPIQNQALFSPFLRLWQLF